MALPKDPKSAGKPGTPGGKTVTSFTKVCTLRSPTNQPAVGACVHTAKTCQCTLAGRATTAVTRSYDCQGLYVLVATAAPSDHNGTLEYRLHEDMKQLGFVLRGRARQLPSLKEPDHPWWYGRLRLFARSPQANPKKSCHALTFREKTVRALHGLAGQAPYARKGRDLLLYPPVGVKEGPPQLTSWTKIVEAFGAPGKRSEVGLLASVRGMVVQNKGEFTVESASLRFLAVTVGATSEVSFYRNEHVALDTTDDEVVDDEDAALEDAAPGLKMHQAATELQGMTPEQLAKELPRVYRALQSLVDEGLIDPDRFRRPR